MSGMHGQTGVRVAITDGSDGFAYCITGSTSSAPGNAEDNDLIWSNTRSSAGDDTTLKHTRENRGQIPSRTASRRIGVSGFPSVFDLNMSYRSNIHLLPPRSTDHQVGLQEPNPPQD